MTPTTTRERLLLVTFSILAVAPFVVAATQASFWRPEHSMAPIVTAVYLGIVAALVVGRFRWAWILLALFYVSVDLPSVIHPPRTVGEVVFVLVALATLALLFSSPMRRRLRRPVTLRNRPA